MAEVAIGDPVEEEDEVMVHEWSESDEDAARKSKMPKTPNVTPKSSPLKKETVYQEDFSKTRYNYCYLFFFLI
jgi:hypothetical protein